MPRTGCSRSAGFSLVELLIALVFISFMMAGMLRIYGSAIQGFSAANESVKAQRDNRVAMDSLTDDISAAGFQFPNVTAPVFFSVDSTSGQNPVMLLPDQQITVTPPDPANPASLLPSEKIISDELQFTTDQPLTSLAHLTAAAAHDGTSLSVQFTQGSFSDIRAGDLILMLDAVPGNTKPYEVSLVGAGVPASGTSGTIPLASSSGQSATSGVGAGSSGGLVRDHALNAEMLFIRPAQVVRYSLMALKQDPSNTVATVPCLVRDQGPYPPTGSRIVWPAAGATIPAGFSRTVVAENVIKLNFNLSLDQGKTWNRAATWPATVTNLDAALATLSSSNPKAGYASAADNPNQPLWYRSAPLLFRADITTRTVLKRADYSATASTASYRTRTQTILVQPRNFGLGQ